MQKLIGYALAFGAGVGATKLSSWRPISSDQHAEDTPGSKMSLKGRNDTNRAEIDDGILQDMCWTWVLGWR
jgi:hypothetical protein